MDSKTSNDSSYPARAAGRGGERRQRRVADLLHRASPTVDQDHQFQIVAADLLPSRRSSLDVLHLTVRVTGGDEEGRQARVKIALNDFGEEQLGDLLSVVGVVDDSVDFCASMLEGTMFAAYLERDGIYYALSDIRPPSAE